MGRGFAVEVRDDDGVGVDGPVRGECALHSMRGEKDMLICCRVPTDAQDPDAASRALALVERASIERRRRARGARAIEPSSFAVR